MMASLCPTQGDSLGNTGMIDVLLRQFRGDKGEPTLLDDCSLSLSDCSVGCGTCTPEMAEDIFNAVFGDDDKTMEVANDNGFSEEKQRSEDSEHKAKKPKNHFDNGGSFISTQQEGAVLGFGQLGGDVPSEQKQLKELHPSDAPSKAPLQDTIGNSPKKQKQKKVSDEEREKWEKRYESTDTLVCALKERAERQAENVGNDVNREVVMNAIEKLGSTGHIILNPEQMRKVIGNLVEVDESRDNLSGDVRFQLKICTDDGPVDWITVIIDKENGGVKSVRADNDFSPGTVIGPVLVERIESTDREDFLDEAQWPVPCPEGLLVHLRNHRGRSCLVRLATPTDVQQIARENFVRFGMGLQLIPEGKDGNFNVRIEQDGYVYTVRQIMKGDMLFFPPSDSMKQRQDVGVPAA